jgi:5'-nucleotidase
MIICLTNDDGIHAPGLRALYHALREAGHSVEVVAPLTEQSAVGHAITVRTPLRTVTIRESGFAGMAVTGTPADCVKLGIGALMDRKPDLVVSGINAGANLGPDIMYSGTVAAAREGAALGYPAIAVSYDDFNCADLTGHARYAVRLIESLPWDKVPERRIMNLNFPARPVSETKGLKLCPQTSAVWRDWYHRREDPRGRPYWWIDGEIPLDKVVPGTDHAFLGAGWITLTPLRFDFTDQECLEQLGRFFP